MPITLTRVRPQYPVERPKLGDPTEREVAFELRQRVTEWGSTDAEFMKNSKFELDFLSGDHWLDENNGVNKRQQMLDIGRSAFSIDLLNPSVDLVVNQVRLGKQTATFVPMGGEANEATAEVRQGLYRNIERESKAQIARETAYQFAVSVGRGYWRVMIEDEDGPTFRQRIGMRRIDSLTSVALDTSGLDPTGADMEWCFIFDDIWRDRFREEFQNAPIDDQVQLDLFGLDIPEDSRNLWFPKDKIRVGEYFRRVWFRHTVVQLNDGTECWIEDAKPGMLAQSGLYIVKQKDKLDYKIEWRKMTGTQTLEKRIWPGRYFPLIVCVGREVFRGRKGKINSGLVRPAMDPSIINDYMTSRTVDEVGLSPLPHFLAYHGQADDTAQTQINNINRLPWSLVQLKPALDERGNPLPMPPGWTSASPNTAAVVQAQAGAKDDLQRVLNTYAPQLGKAQSSQLSGIAQREAKDSGDVSHAQFPDNFRRSLYQEGVVVNDLMDVVYTEPQAIAITQPDERTKQVLINQWIDDKKTGKKIKHLFGGDATYGVIISTGDSYPTQMAQAADKLLSLAQEFPQQMAQCLDLLITDLNIPGAEKYKERLRTVLNVKSNEDGNQPTLPQLQAQVQQLTQVNQQAHTLIQQLLGKVAELGSEEAIKRLKIASDERKAAAQVMGTIVVQEMKDSATGARDVLLAQLEQIVAELNKEADVNASAANPPPQPQVAPQGPPQQPPGLPPVAPVAPPKPQQP